MYYLEPCPGLYTLKPHAALLSRRVAFTAFSTAASASVEAQDVTASLAVQLRTARRLFP